MVGDGGVSSSLLSIEAATALVSTSGSLLQGRWLICLKRAVRSSVEDSEVWWGGKDWKLTLDCLRTFSRSSRALSWSVGSLPMFLPCYGSSLGWWGCASVSRFFIWGEYRIFPVIVAVTFLVGEHGQCEIGTNSQDFNTGGLQRSWSSLVPGALRFLSIRKSTAKTANHSSRPQTVISDVARRQFSKSTLGRPRAYHYPQHPSQDHELMNDRSLNLITK